MTMPRAALIALITFIAIAAPRGRLAEGQRQTGTTAFHCSPAPCVLPPLQASEGGSIVTDPTIAVDPLNQNELLLGSADFNCPEQSGVGFHLSTDGGSTWSRVLCMDAIQHNNIGYLACDEPYLGYDAKGTTYVSGDYCGGTENEAYELVGVQKSADGTHWSKPAIALHKPGVSTPYLIHLSVDASPSSPWSGAVYVSGVMVWAQHNNHNQIWVSHSNDGGAIWNHAAVDRVQKSPSEDRLTRMAVAADGTVYVTWLRCSSTCSSGHILFSKSTDGGNTWSSPAKIATVHDWDLPNTYERVYNYPSIAVDNSSGPYSGNLYVAMYNWTGTYLKVQMTRSTDGGTTWSKPMRLAPESDTHDQFFPAISVSGDGKVGVSWLDRRNDPNDIDYQAFGAISTDGGKSFGQNWQLTTAFSNPKVNGTGNNWMGDYTGNAWKSDNEFVAAWMDSSNGVDMQEVVGGVRLK